MSDDTPHAPAPAAADPSAVAATDPAFWRGRAVLVTGATGLLGSALTRQLVARGARVVCLVRDWLPEAELVRSGTIARVAVVRGDLTTPGLIGRVLRNHDVATVFHLAAQTLVGFASADPLATFETNVAGTWTVLDACRRHAPAPQVLVASSDKAYGEQEHLPYDETQPLRGAHPYDASKACADLLAQSYARAHGMAIGITRCGNLYGGGDRNWNRLIPGTIRALLAGEAPVLRSDGRYVRDYLYVEDAAAAYLLLAEQLAARPQLAGEAFNFSHECQLTVVEMVERLAALLDSPLRPVILGTASGEIRHQYLSAAKARALLGWAPAHTLDEGLRATIAWYRRFLDERAR